MNILIVDDLPTNLKLLRAQLVAHGHAVLEAANGVEALTVLECEPVDAIISDILMPVMDGYRLCYEVRHSERLQHIPFIFYTAIYTSTDDVKLCFDLGADKYLKKPASPEVILATLHEVVRGPRKPPPGRALLDEFALLKEYSERLVHKLEEQSNALDLALARLQASESERKQSERHLRLFVEHSPAAIAMLDREMRYLVVSRRWLADYRLGERDIIGLSHYELFPEISGRWKDIHRRCLDGATEKCSEDVFPRADGSTEWIRWEVRPWHDAQDAVGGLIIFSEVITERKQAEEAKAKHTQELETFHRLSVGRELRMVELKEQINALSIRTGHAPPYDLPPVSHERIP
jgi:PAS domain S-box-containing protein